MTEVKIVWTEKNVWDFVKFTIINRAGRQKFFIVSLIICFIFVSAFSILSAFIIKNAVTLAIALLVPVLLAAYIVGYYFILKNYAKKIYGANKDNRDSSALIGEDNIIICENDFPKSRISWDEIEDITINSKLATYYIMSKDSSLLMLEESNIVKGDRYALLKVLEEKKNDIERAKQENERSKADGKKN